MADKKYLTISQGFTAHFTPATWDDEDVPKPSCLEIIDNLDPIVETSKKIPHDLLYLSELSLEDKIRDRDNGKIDRTLGLVKLMFWDEYDRAIYSRSAMNMDNVWKPLTSEAWWKINILKNPLNLAWVLTPPADQIIIKREMLNIGMARLREALELPIREKVKTTITGEDGEKKTVFIWQTNVPLLKEIHSIVKTLQDRVHGSVVQTHHVKSLNVNMGPGGKSMNMANEVFASKSTSLEQLEEYEQKLLLIEQKLMDIVSHDGEVIEQ